MCAYIHTVIQFLKGNYIFVVKVYKNFTHKTSYKINNLCNEMKQQMEVMLVSATAKNVCDFIFTE